EILNELQKRAITASQQRFLGNNINLGEFDRMIQGKYPTTAETYQGSRFFGILVANVEQNICRHILNNKPKMASDVFVVKTGEAGTDECPDGEAQIKFIFTDDFSTTEPVRRCTKQRDCASACEACQNGICIQSCPSGQECTRSSGAIGSWGLTGWKYADTSVQCCPSELVVNGTCCASVSYDETGNKLCCKYTNQTSCCPAGQFHAGEQCYDCDEPNGIYGTLGISGCDMCPNRVLVGERGCALECPDPDQIVWNGRCLCPNERPILDTHSGKCLPCGIQKGLWHSAFVGMLEMDRQPATGTVALYCGHMWIQAGYVGKIEEGYIPYYQVVLKDPADKPVLEKYGDNRVRCDQVYIEQLKYQSQCETCGGTWTGKWWDGTCTPPTN
ncbi:MAG: hypothetical protein ACI4OR_04120, partial [Alphaproteobacteria bacterium]